MVSINVANVITIGLIALLFVAGAKWVANKVGIASGWF
jgi:hypothetical protein